MSATRHPTAKELRNQAWFVLVAMGFVDFIIGASTGSRPDPGPYVAGGLVGFCLGQPALLASWAVVGPQRLLVRWPLTLLATSSLACALFFGLLVAHAEEPQILVYGLAFLPICFLAAQLPVWILKLATGCRMVLDGGDGGSQVQRSRQFRVRDMLAVTTAVAVSLGLARLALADFGGPGGRFDPDTFVTLAVFCGVAALWSGFLTVPCLYAALVARDVGKGILAIAAYTFLMSLVVALIVAASVGGTGPGAGELFGFFLFFNGGSVSVVLGPLLIARVDGYVLLWPRRAKAAAGENQADLGGQDTADTV